MRAMRTPPASGFYLQTVHEKMSTYKEEATETLIRRLSNFRERTNG